MQSVWAPILIVALVGGLVSWIGSLLAHDRVKPNIWMGVRTPATMKDPEVWYRVNRAAGRAMQSWGIAIGAMGLTLSVIPAAWQPWPFVAVVLGGNIWLWIVIVQAHRSPAAGVSTPRSDPQLPIR